MWLNFWTNFYIIQWKQHSEQPLDKTQSTNHRERLSFLVSGRKYALGCLSLHLTCCSERWSLAVGIDKKLPRVCGNRQGETSLHRSCIINGKDLLWVAVEVALLEPLWVHLMCSATPYQPNSFQNTVHYMTFYTLHCTLLAINNLQGHGLLLQTAPWQFTLEHFQPFLHHCLRHDHCSCHRQYHFQGLLNLEVR